MNAQECADLANKLVDMVHEWIVAKLVAGDGFSVLLMSGHSDGNHGSLYTLDSDEEALRACRADLADRLGSAHAYALAYDARAINDGEVVRVLIYQIEHRFGKTSARARLPYVLSEATLSRQAKFTPLGPVQPMSNGEKWLIAPLT